MTSSMEEMPSEEKSKEFCEEITGAVTESARLRRHRSGLQELPHIWGQGWWPRGAPHVQGQARWPRWPTLRPRSGAAAGWATPRPRSGCWLRRATTRRRSGEPAKRSNPMSKEQRLRRNRRAKRSYSTFKVRRGGCEETLLVWGKEQQLRLLEQPWRDTRRPR